MRSATANSLRLSLDRGLLAWGVVAALLACLPLPGWGQSSGNNNSVRTSSVSISPNTGTSTLDQLRPAKGDAVDLQFPSGFNCRVNSGDVPSLILYGDQGALGAENLDLVSGSRAGLAFILPLHRSRRSLCDKPMKLQNALSELEIAEKLVTIGAMSDEEFMNLSQKIKAQLFGG